MIEPSLAVQKTLVARLTKSEIYQLAGVAVIDRGGRPEVAKCIIIGQAHTIFPDYFDTFSISTVADLHIWTKEDDLVSVKAIAGAAREALWRGPWTVEGHCCVNIRVEQARFMRDPDGIHSHGVMTVTAILQEDAQP